jgi:hypothetical protein
MDGIFCSHGGGEDVNVGLPGCDAVWTCWKIPTFRKNILPPSSALTLVNGCYSIFVNISIFSRI